jgi:hypothetical protein
MICLMQFLFVNMYTHLVSIVCIGAHSRSFKNKASKREIIYILLGNIDFLKAEHLNSHSHSVICDDYNSVTCNCLNLWQVWSIVMLFIHNLCRLKYQQVHQNTYT